MSVESIKAAINGLPAEEKASLTAGLLEQDRQEWDKQIEADFSPGGAAASMLEGVDRQISAGNVAAFKVTQPRGKA